MARYGGEEDLQAARKAIRGLNAGISELGAKELMVANAEEVLTGRLQAGNKVRRVTAQASEEAARAIERETAVRGVNTRGLRAEADALEANTRARQHNATAQRQQQQRQTDFARSLRYAQDPLFAQANDVVGAGGGVRQLRTQLGVGYTRARGLADAVASGIRPQGLTTAQAGPAMTRVEAAQLAVAKADQEYEAARRAYTNVTRRKTASDQELLGASRDRTAAQAAREGARAELSAAQEARRTADARVQERNAITRAREASIVKAEADRDAAAAEREFTRMQRQWASQGRGLIRHPELFNRQAYAPISQPVGMAAGVGGRTPEQIAALQRLQDASGAGARTPPRPPVILRPDFTQARAVSTLSGLTEQERAYAQAIMGRVQAYKNVGGAEANLSEQQHREGQYAQQQLTNIVAASRARDMATASGDKLAASTGRVIDSTRAAAVAYGTESQALRRRGALTSEFIAAAARGETTMRELGYQTVVTAAKFGGWTLAASALYGVANAAREVGRGAIDAQSGVHQLTRVVNDVNPQTAQQAFSDLASEFNVPIDVASDAVYRMGQRFHDQASAIEAARAALYSFKTGEVDVATSTENLLAVVNGFGLSAQDLARVYDQINQAQNTFGIRIADTEAGLAKAAGTYRNAGGDLNYLLALFVAISRATNRSGQEIGTGIARGVNQIRNPSNRARLSALGVDVDPNDFQTTLQSAMKRAQQGADPNLLAAGLMGNQYARLIAPVLRDQTTLNDALRETSPQASAGSAVVELHKVLQQVDEQIQMIGVNLQRFGVALARAGVFNVFGGLLRLINGLLDKTTDLVNLFNRLVPPDIRPFVVGLTEAAAAIALMRRTGGLNGRVAERLPFLASPDRRLQVLASRGMRDQLSEITNGIERTSRDAYMAAVNAEVRTNIAAQSRTGFQQRAAAGLLPAIGTEGRVAAELELKQLDEAAIAAARHANALQQEINAARQVQLRAEQDLAAIKGLHHTEVRRYLAENNIPVPAELQTPSSKGIARVTPEGAVVSDAEAAAATAAGARRVAAATVVAGEGIATAMVAAEHEIQRAVATVAVEQMALPGMRNFAREAADAAAAGHGQLAMPVPDAGRYTNLTGPRNRFARAGRGVLDQLARDTAPLTGALGNARAAMADGRWGVAARGLESAGTAVASAAARAGRMAGRTARSLRGAGGALAGLARSLGPLDLALITFIAGEAINSAIEKLSREVDDAENFIEGYRGRTQEAQRKFAEHAKSQLGPQTNQQYRNDNLQRVNDLFNPVRLFGHTLPSIVSGDYETPQDRANRVRLEYAQQQQEAELRGQLQDKARARGGAIPQLTYDQLTAKVDEDARLRRAGLITQREFDRRMANHAIEAKVLLDPTTDQLNEANAAIAAAYNAAGDPKSFRRSLPTLDDKGLQDAQSYVTSALETFGASPRRLANLTAVYQDAVRRYGNKTDLASINALDTARKNFYDALQQSAQGDLQLALSGASEQERQQAYSGAGASYRQALNRARRLRDRAATRLKDARDRLKTARDAASDGPEVTTRPTDPIFGVQDFGGSLSVPQTVEDLRKDAERARKDVKKFAQDRDKFRREFDAAKRKYKLLMEELRQASYQDRASGRQIDLALEQSQTRDPTVQATAAIRSARAQVQDAARTYGQQSREYRQALTELNQARSQAFDAYIAGVQAEASLMVASAGSDPTRRAQASVSSARQTLNALTSERAKKLGIDPNAITEARAQLIEAQTALADQLRQNAMDLLAADYALRESRTTDPVRQAFLQLKLARKNRSFARTPAEQKNAQADVNRQRRAWLDAQLQSREGDIDFELQMERISTDVAISRYQALLKLHTLTKQQRRDILLKIKQLRDDADSASAGFDLDVGSIKMPTIYDVRRALAPVRDQIAEARRQVASTVRPGGSTDWGRHAPNAWAGSPMMLTVNVTVDGKGDVRSEVIGQIDRALKTAVKAKVKNRRRK